MKVRVLLQKLSEYSLDAEVYIRNEPGIETLTHPVLNHIASVETDKLDVIITQVERNG